jgi:alpha-D-xyloside xylohydrolase
MNTDKNLFDANCTDFGARLCEPQRADNTGDFQCSSASVSEQVAAGRSPALLRLHPGSSGFIRGFISLLAVFVTLSSAAAVTLTFHTNAPIPSATDVFNFSGATRDGLNVNNGATFQDGAGNDAFTYIARDRAQQGQTFVMSGTAEAYLLKAIWIRHAGYTANGQPGNAAADYNGTWWDFSGGGTFNVRVTDPAAAGTANFALRSESYSLTGAEPDNPGVRPSNGTTDNGTGRWLRFELSTPVILTTNKTYGFDLISNGGVNRYFEWLGTASASAFAGGSAYTGDTSGQSGGPDRALNPLTGDRVFLVELAALVRPKLSIALTSSTLATISWPSGPVEFHLQCNTNLAGSWEYAALSVSIQGGTNSTTDSIEGGAKYYRLRMGTGEAPIPVLSVQPDAAGATLQMNPGTMKLQVFSPRAIRVAYSVTNSIPTNSLAVIAAPTNSGWTLTQTASDVRLATSAGEVRVNRGTGAVGFYDTNGQPVLVEKTGGGKKLTTATVGGVATLQSRQTFELPVGEAIYGLGQHQSGIMNYRGTSVHLQQMNPGESGIPVLVSSRGYGILWDNPAISDVDVGQTSPTNLVWTSEAADAIDYYFLFGPELDDVIASYRQLTGAAPLFGKWAWGLWQCKNAYASQQELLGVVAAYRTNNIPLDGIIQDWQWWWNIQNTSIGNRWGSHIFYAPNYPNPTNLMTTLHATNVHAIISVWARFDVGIQHANELAAVNGLFTNVLNNVYPPGQGQWYDPFNAAARSVYWGQLAEHIFSTGFDGWWFDASECELSGNWGEFRNYTTAAGPGVKVFNAYPLMHTTTAYQGQRAQTSAKRVFTLTRSAYAGQQRNAAVTWSGDIGSSWSVLAKQIPAGLNFSVSGVPYWNTDTGGFNDGSPNNAAYAEIFTRWFQFSAFCPMLRIHGNNAKEIWRFPGATQAILIDYTKLRYHLLPYIYSVSWQVTSAGDTMLRPLVMDFRTDTNVFGLKDQFLFGPALMACPVTASTTTRSVYLPAGTTWYNFWTGATNSGGQTLNAPAPIETMPLFVRAGSVLPYGPDIQFATQSVDPLEIRVYRGANGSFTLYEDENDNYNYETGSYATIPFTWNEATQTLTIGARQGSFPGMLSNRTFRIVWVSSGHGVGVANTTVADSVVVYNGTAVQIQAGP